MLRLKLIALGSVAAAVCAVSAGGCAATPVVGTEPTVLWGEEAASAPEEKRELTADEARRIAVAHDAAYSCEQTAKAMYKKDRQRGWAVMRECILRNDFTDLEILIEGVWAEPVAKDKEAAILYAHVIAARGGDVVNDLRLLRRRKLPVYSAGAAVSEPESYKGRTVIMRGLAKQGRTVEGGRAFRLIETKVMAEGEWVTAPGSTRVTTKSNNELADQPGVDVKGRGVVERNNSQRTERMEVLHNVDVETGVEMVARVESAEPSLEPATNYVLVVRFEGVKESVDEEGGVDEEAVGVVVAYFEPESGMFARLGR